MAYALMGVRRASRHVGIPRLTASELSAFMAGRESLPLVVVPELREYPVKMRHQLPHRWLDLDVAAELNAAVAAPWTKKHVHITISTSDFLSSLGAPEDEHLPGQR